MLIAQIDSLAKEIKGFREDFEQVTECYTRHDEQIKTHGTALKYLFGMVSGIAVGLVIAWIRTSFK
jgi:F0F1-type ATP synthase assembly protein I